MDTTPEEQDDSGHPPTLEPEAPWILTQLLAAVIGLVSNYGWPCLLVALLAAFLYNKYKVDIAKWQRKREDDKDAQLYHKNPDIFLARETAVESTRQRLQDQYAAASAAHADKTKLLEDERKRLKLADAEAKLRGSGGHRLRQAAEQESAPTPAKLKAKFRPDYNPMVGSGPACSYRPARRGGAGGGG